MKELVGRNAAGMAIAPRSPFAPTAAAQVAQSAAGPGHWIENVRFGFEQDTGACDMSACASVNDLTDRRYVGTVIVNEANSRLFEPASGGGAFLMFTAGHRDRPGAP